MTLWNQKDIVQWSIEFFNGNFIYFRHSDKTRRAIVIVLHWRKKCVIIRRPFVKKKILPEGFFLFTLYVDAKKDEIPGEG